MAGDFLQLEPAGLQELRVHHAHPVSLLELERSVEDWRPPEVAAGRVAVPFLAGGVNRLLFVDRFARKNAGETRPVAHEFAGRIGL